MVFNWPVGDSVIVHEGVIAHDYYAILRNQAFINCVRDLKAFDNNGINLSAERYEKLESKYLNAARKKLISGGGLTQSPVGPIDKTGGIATLPIDKKENYIKRCVAVGGDTLEIVNNLLLINGKAEKQKDEVIFNYNFYFKPGSYIPQDKILEDFEIYNDQHTRFNIENKYVSEVDTSFKDSIVYTKKLVAFSKEQITCSPKTAKMLTRYSGLDSMGQDIHPRGFDYSIYGQYYPYFPNHPDFDWSRDNYGPLIVPKKGWSVSLNDSTWTLYKRVIEVYEGNDIEINVSGDFLINNKIENQYTFKQNYYWLMGDNRHGSADSRCWGFVPEDHVVGTASFVWFSKHPETGIRWSRIFSTVH